MPDFEVATIHGTAAETAVSYILQRMINDCNFQHYMLGTTALQLCLIAEAERRGMGVKKLEKELARKVKDASSRLRKSGAEWRPDVVRLREELGDALDEAEYDRREAARIEHEQMFRTCPGCGKRFCHERDEGLRPCVWCGADLCWNCGMLHVCEARLASGFLR